MQMSMVLMALGVLGCSFGREWYHSLSGVVLLIIGLVMGGHTAMM
jgi:hypothetical protein